MKREDSEGRKGRRALESEVTLNEDVGFLILTTFLIKFRVLDMIDWK